MHRVGVQRSLIFRTRFAPPSSRLAVVRHSSATAIPTADATIINDKEAITDDSLTGFPERGLFFIESVLPTRYAEWDIRTWIYDNQAPSTLDRIKERLSSVKTHGFTITGAEATSKDGGVFLKFGYHPSPGVSASKALEEIKADLRKQISSESGITPWWGIGRVNLHTVKGKPWNEDMSVYPTNILKVEFEGPDVHQEALYEVLRPYGRIMSITKPGPVPAGTLRFVTVTFSRIHSAILARNCLYGVGLADNTLSNAGTASGPTKTRLVFTYERPIKAHFFRDWISSHPRIVLPVVAFLLGTITYTIFDPIRSFFVRSKVLGYFDYQEWRVVKFIRKNMFDKVKFTVRTSSPNLSSIDEDSTIVPATSTVTLADPFSATTPTAPSAPSTHIHEKGEWKERVDAERYLLTYLADTPNTIAVLHGPQGSGKSKLLKSVLNQVGKISGADGDSRKIIEIDCEEMYKNGGGSDSGIVSSLAKQTGYWPVFSFLSSMNNLIDLAAVGLIGQKAGFSTTVETQMKEILEVTGGALKNVTSELVKQKAKHQPKQAPVQASSTPVEIEKFEQEKTKDATPPPETATEKGGSSIPIIGAAVSSSVNVVSSSVNAVSSSVAGARDEFQGLLNKTGIVGERIEGAIDEEWKRGTVAPTGPPRILDTTVNTMPVVVIKNFAAKNAGKREDLLNVIADWAATLIDNKVAHVIVISDNRENQRRLAKALPTRPLMSIPLGDADTASAMAFVKSKINSLGATQSLSAEDQSWLERLGGRASDLDTLIHRVRNGLSIKDAVQDIIARGVGELKKSAFGDDAEDAKALPWQPEQVWSILKQLAKNDEISYAEVLLEFPFKGDEAALRGMEHAELISITTQDGLPVSIRPGKPVYRYVFQRLVNDTIFHAVQDIAYNNKAIAAEESTIRKCEEELLTLKTIGLDTGSSFLGGSGATASRANYLLSKMKTSEEKLEHRERDIKRLKKVLATAALDEGKH